jgi:alpha-L-rhamnosidase
MDMTATVDERAEQRTMATPHELLAEYSRRPIGLWTATPLLSWQLDPGSTEATGYQVQVASTPEHLDADEPDLWDTGLRPHDGGWGIRYDGAPLTSRQQCWWRVRAADAEVTGPWSSYESFELSLLHAEDWTARWTGRPGSHSGGALYLRQAFELTQGVRRARLYVTGLGWYQARLNGRRVGDALLEPAPTDTSRRLHFATHDVTEGLMIGVNVLGAILGHGWNGDQKLLAQLEITLDDGQQVMVGTGQTGIGLDMWHALHGPIVAESMYDGETYDARLENPQWDNEVAQLDAAPMRDLNQAMMADAPGGVLTPRPLPGIEVTETRAASRITEPRPGVFVVDTGQNLAGWLRITVDGAGGDEISLRYAENLYADGTVNQENLRSALATDRLITDGRGPRTWEPTMTSHGFRYVQIEGWPGTPRLSDVEVRVVRSALERTATFDSSDPLIDRINEAVYWTEVSNTQGVPTDCPQRNERMGWLNDMAARSDELVYTFDSGLFLSKWMDDIADTQSADGSIADTAPYRFGTRPADPISVCYALIPVLLIRHYGDLQTADRHFDGIVRWFDYLTSRADNGVVSYSNYGDWAPPIAFGSTESFSALSAFTPGDLVSTAHYHYTATLVAVLAEALGKDADRRRFVDAAADIAAAFHEQFWSGPDIGYGSGNQACNAIALYMGLVPEEQLETVVELLVSDVLAHDTHLTTGNLATKYLLEVLAAHGHIDLAVRLVQQRTYPSWGFMLDNGATTIWERWENETGGEMNSHNHPMYGSVAAFLYRHVAGIKIPSAAVGCSEILFDINPAAGLDRASASLESVRGRIAVSWRRRGDSVQVDVVVPAGCRAVLETPHGGGERRVVPPGTHELVIALPS